MAHFANVVDGVVVQVVVAEEDFVPTLKQLFPGEWIQTSYNTFGGVHHNPNTMEPSVDQSKALRKNYATIGGTYDKQRDAFIPPKDFPSWVLNEDTCQWDPPIPKPEGEIPYLWDEENTRWVLK